MPIIFLCIYVSFVNYKPLYLQKSTFLNDSDVYFVSKTSRRTEIAGNLHQQRNPSGGKEFSNSLKAALPFILFHRACFVLALIALAGNIDTESNQGYQTLDDAIKEHSWTENCSFKHTKSRTQSLLFAP